MTSGAQNIKWMWIPILSDLPPQPWYLTVCYRLQWLGEVLMMFWPITLVGLAGSFFGGFAVWLWCLAQVAPIK